MTGRKARLGATTALLLITAACASTTPEKALAPMGGAPANWSTLSSEYSEAAPSLTSDWLSDLNDPTVSMLVGEAIAYNNDLAATAARVKATRERVGVTRSGLLPSISGTVSGTRARAPETPTTPVTYSNSDLSLGLSLSWELDVWARLTDTTRASYLDAAASALDLASTKLSIAGSAAQSFYSLTEARLQRQLSERDVETGEANLRIIERRYDRGISSSLDVRLARSSLAQSQATLVSRQQAEQEAARRLETLLGRYPSATIDVASSLPSLPQINDGAYGTPAELLLRRPDVIAAERRMKASGLRVSAARKAFLPNLSLTGSASEDGRSLADILDPESVVASLTANLVQPLFQGGRLRAEAKATKAEMEASLHSYVQTVLTAYREVEDTLAAERFLAAQENAQHLAFEEAAAAEELTTRQYLNGTTNIFNLINAQQRRIQSEGAYIAASRARLTNRIDLYLALGAPFETPEFTRASAAPSSLPSNSQVAGKSDREGASL